ncbi:VRR-NUC domain-containing protein [Paraburkholderia youngii]|uniref:VRR-NUC domain-containing protein n=1 Tax=Paraburkholderia youngii TaxID=2782701 RepID=UPI00159237E9|nr:VRR-NUC domain-containing protein [Paraburkholderia youngii]NUX58686.1 VRR-NUC domain-containing protein [Paraburkholderia youngii]
MKENAVETYLVRELEKIGCDCPKFVSPSRSGVVDRLCIPPLGLRTDFIECKAPGKDLDPLQVYERDMLRRRGQRHEVIDTCAKVDRYVAEKQREIQLRAQHLARAAAKTLQELQQ